MFFILKSLAPAQLYFTHPFMHELAHSQALIHSFRSTWFMTNPVHTADSKYPSAKGIHGTTNADFSTILQSLAVYRFMLRVILIVER